MRPVTTTTRMPASRAAASAASVRGRRTRSSPTSVRSKSHATAWSACGKSSGRASGAALAAGRLGDERRDVLDLLLAQLVGERRHPAAPVLDLLDGRVEARLQLVEVRPGRP